MIFDQRRKIFYFFFSRFFSKIKKYFFRANQTQEEYESNLKATREQQRNAWSAKPESVRKQRGAKIAAQAKIRRQAEDEITTDERKKADAKRKRGWDRKKR